MDRSILFGIESLSAGNGGICRVARLMIRVVSEELHSDFLKMHSISLKDVEVIRDINIHVTLTKGSKLRYFYEVQRASLCFSHFIYDFVGMARAHCVIPILR